MKGKTNAVDEEEKKDAPNEPIVKFAGKTLQDKLGDGMQDKLTNMLSEMMKEQMSLKAEIKKIS